MVPEGNQIAQSRYVHARSRTTCLGSDQAQRFPKERFSLHGLEGAATCESQISLAAFQYPIYCSHLVRRLHFIRRLREIQMIWLHDPPNLGPFLSFDVNMGDEDERHA